MLIKFATIVILQKKGRMNYQAWNRDVSTDSENNERIIWEYSKQLYKDHFDSLDKKKSNLS
jgi:hypothetical protein